MAKPQQIFINLPVQNLNKSKEFFSKLGFSFNPAFTSDDAVCMIIADNIFAMLLTYEHFKKFSKKEMVDAHKANEMLLCISRPSRASVDDILAAAVKAGGKDDGDRNDHGFMYDGGFYDLDGHAWGVAWMANDMEEQIKKMKAT